jgi:hypothetical protein
MPPVDPFNRTVKPLPVLTPEQLAEKLRKEGISKPDIHRVDVKKPAPPRVKVWLYEILWGLVVKGAGSDLNKLNKGEEPVFFPLLLKLVSQNFGKVLIAVVALVGIVVALIRLL